MTDILKNSNWFCVIKEYTSIALLVQTISHPDTRYKGIIHKTKITFISALIKIVIMQS